jgi:hypothetical protein
MEKVLGRDTQDLPASIPDRLDITTLVKTVEATSEDPGYPIEAALAPVPNGGWKAAHQGPQAIRLVFYQPQKIKGIHLEFHESESERTQEFVLRWSPDRGHSYQEIVRQQFNFSPSGATTEREDYRVDLEGVTRLELSIVPNISGGSSRASLGQLSIS